MTAQQPRAPWHLWAVGAVVLALYLMGAWDYVMILTMNQQYFDSQSYGAAVVDYFSDYPLIPRVFWTVAIAGGLISVGLLLMRHRWAVPVALVSAVANLCLALATFGFMNRWTVLGPAISSFDVGIVVLMFAVWWYCRRQRSRGVLR